VISAYYYLRVVKVMYLSPASADEPIGPGVPIRLALAGTFVATVFFGIYPTPLIDLARTAVSVLVT
jgi:NADH-quinone oxidoreductase subunit N